MRDLCLSECFFDFKTFLDFGSFLASEDEEIPRTELENLKLESNEKEEEGLQIRTPYLHLGS